MVTDTITVNFGGKDHIIYREEILRGTDTILKDTFMLMEATKNDLMQAEKVVHQLRHAVSSIGNTLQHASVKYIAEKYKSDEATKSQPKED